MQITERSAGHVTVLDLNGPLTGGGGTQRLKDKVNSLVLQKLTNVLINLGEVAFIDSSGLGEIVSCLTTVSKAGGKLKLVNLTKRNHELLSITRLATVFDTFDSEPEAIKSFGPPSGA